MPPRKKAANRRTSKTTDQTPDAGTPDTGRADVDDDEIQTLAESLIPADVDLTSLGLTAQQLRIRRVRQAISHARGLGRYDDAKRLRGWLDQLRG